MLNHLLAIPEAGGSPRCDSSCGKPRDIIVVSSSSLIHGMKAMFYHLYFLVPSRHLLFSCLESPATFTNRLEYAVENTFTS